MTGFLLRFVRELRLVPVVLMATIALFALKALGLLLDGGYLFENPVDGRDADPIEITGTIAAPKPAHPPGKTTSAAGKPSWAQQMFNFPDATGSVEPPPSPPPIGLPKIQPNPDITGAVEATPAPPAADAPAKKKTPQEPPPASGGTPVSLEVEHPVSPAERAILESLQKRRAELDARARDLDVREDLLRAAEKRVGGRIDELKDLEARVDTAVQQKDAAEEARFKNVVTMYENMKAKDAAKIFDGLDIRVLLDVAKEINPRRMSDILAQMAPENAQRLTIEMAARSAQKDQPQAAELPKIQGKPSPN
jgi:flagellar motility protein MotE (MotC chaperone)